jgi:NAD(P)-dependent dehydrogenase (short-subunit alcohol dehydrogenase family)
MCVARRFATTLHFSHFTFKLKQDPQSRLIRRKTLRLSISTSLRPFAYDAFSKWILNADRGAKIVNISSVVGVLPIPYMALYSAAKSALQAYSETLRLELSPLGYVDSSTLLDWYILTLFFQGRCINGKYLFHRLPHNH